MALLVDNSDFLLNIINAVPSPLLVVDRDVKIIQHNIAASAVFEGKAVYMKRGGDALNCINAGKTPEGCGHADECRDCVIRNSVNEAFDGRKVHRKKTSMKFISDGSVKDLNVLVTTAPFSYDNEDFALLIMEDISELLQLRSLLPICAWCKKIRNDDNYWQNLEEYLRTHHDLVFSHGICEECFNKYYKQFNP